MKMKRLLPLAALLIAAAAHAETMPLNFELGYRWLHQSGDELMYRTQINERSGFLIRNLSLATPELRIDASDLGVGPASALRLDSSRTGAYKFTLRYRSTEAFSALPTFSNPLLAQGIFVGQHTYDRTRRMFDVNLQFIPDRAFAPFIGYGQNSNHGPEQTTYTIGQDEFALGQNLHENDREFRVGADFHFATVTGQITQGWRKFTSSDSYSLPTASIGNNIFPILGQQTTATTIVRNDNTDVKTPFTNAYATATLGSRLTLLGDYVRFAADSTGNLTESAAGNFTSFTIDRFFTGLNETASSSAKNTTWRGGARAEYNFWRDVDFLAGYNKEHRDLSGSALIDTLFLQSVTFDHTDLKTLEQVINSNNSMKRTETVLNAGIAARSMGPWAFRAEYLNTKQSIEASPDAAEIVVPGNQSGTFDRKIDTFDSSLTFNKAGWLLSASWRRDNADQVIFRTDYLDRNRYRFRATWKAPRWVRVGVTGETTHQTNPAPDVNLNADVRQYIGDIEITPISVLALHGSYSKFRADSAILYRVPQNFTTDTSDRLENGYGREGGFMLTFPKWTFDTDISKFENTGSAPFKVDHYRARLTFDLKARTGIAAEWNRDKYTDQLSVSDYRADRYGVYFRWLP